ncbi:MAG: sugar ABC transporter permease [Spirochaetaceae bacterium]|nr:sugar ABC transporter permease [Spirochaetaceae bacterium]MDT8297257.1 sugar ABC transporter permease [Spirochaetaceae bacterium]
MSVKSRKNSLWILLFLAPVLLLFFIYFVYPLGFVFVTSTVEWNGVSTPKFVGIQHYLSNLQNKTFLLSVKNNFIWLFANGFLQIGMAATVALILARKPKFWRTLRTVYFLPNVISQVAIAMMWSALYNAEYGALNQLLTAIGLENLTHNWLGEFNTALPAIIVQQVFYIGYFMIIILASVMTIPDSLYEAAEIDGAGVWQQEFHITLPMIKDILVTAMTLAMAYGLRHFEATFLLTNGGPANRTSVLGILLYKKLSALKYGEASSISATLVILGLIMIIVIRSTIGRKSSASDLTQ